MKFLDKLEKKIGRFAIPNLSLILIIGYAIGYVCYYVKPLNVVLYTCMLDPASVMNGQVWRLITWIIMPPSPTNIFFYLIMMLFYYQLGTALERTWGSFRFNLYILGGIIFTDIGVMIGFQIFAALGMVEVLTMGAAVSTYYINLGIFLAFALTNPDNRVMLYFIIPIKMKWLAIVYGALVLVSFITADNGTRVVIASSLLNFLIFFVLTQFGYGGGFKGGFASSGRKPHASAFTAHFNRSREQTSDAGPSRAVHKCCICGRTNLTDPNLEFRYCSKCMGNYEYCNEHLFTHTHVR